VKAEQEGIAVHFSQQNAETLDFADGFFDLIVSSFFFHEVPVPSNQSASSRNATGCCPRAA